MAKPACLSPKSCVISDRSSPSPAPAVPAITFEDQLIPQWTQIHAAKRHCGEPGKSNSLRAGVARQTGFDALELQAVRTPPQTSAKSNPVAMRQQPLGLGDDGPDIAELALQVLPRNLRVGRPRLGHEARAGTDAQRRGGLPLAVPQRHGLADQARRGRDRRVIGGSRRGMTPPASTRYNFL